MKVNSVKLIISEINECLKNNLGVGALYMALTLPDVCGFIKYGNIKPHDRFVQWYDEYIGKYELQNDSDFKLPGFSGENVFQIRCALFHEGSNNLQERFKLDKFLFDWNGSVGRSGIEMDEDGKLFSYWHVCVPVLCQTIIWGVQNFLIIENVSEEKIPQFNEYGIEDIPEVFRAKF